MKKHKYLLLAVLALILCTNCNKSKDRLKSNFTDLNDLTVSSQWANYSSFFDLDFDKDGNDDLMIATFSSFSGGWGGYSESYIKVYPSNGFEIAFSDCITTSWSWNPEIDTIYVIDIVMVPKIFQLGNTIYLDGEYTQNPIMISYKYSPAETDYSSGREYSVQENSNYYMAFRKINGTNSKLAWLRVNSHGGASISLNSCYYTENENSLIIEEF